MQSSQQINAQSLTYEQNKQAAREVNKTRLQ